MNSKKFAKRKKDSGVSPVIATILMVAITVVLAAVLYVMVSGFTHSPGTANSAGLNEATGSAAGSYVVSISSVSASNIPVSGLKIIITQGSTSITYTDSGSWGSTVTGAPTVTYTQSTSGATYLSAGDSFNIVQSTASGAVNLSGATVTLYNGNSELGTTIL